MKKLMITLSAGVWDGMKHRPHHFMNRAAASGYTILYVEPPVTILGPIKNWRLIQQWKRSRQGIQKVAENIYVLAPPPIWPFGSKYRMINRINQWWLARSILHAINVFGNERVSIYSFLPHAVDLLPHLPIEKVYYDCVDDHAAFTGLINPHVIQEMERELMTQADVSFATARELLEERKAWSKKFHLVPNGAEYEHFSKVQQEVLFIPHDMDGLSHPIIGFIGGISNWVDLSLIAEAAQKLPDASFVMIGPVDTSIHHLKKHNNIHFLGSKPYEQLPRYIQAFDACIIPFKVNQLTKSVNPIKMYEYLSAGKPVISTALPEVLPFEETIDIIYSADDLCDSIKRLINANSTDLIAKRQAIGKENSWDARWERVLGEL